MTDEKIKLAADEDEGMFDGLMPSEQPSIVLAPPEPAELPAEVTLKRRGRPPKKVEVTADEPIVLIPEDRVFRRPEPKVHKVRAHSDRTNREVEAGRAALARRGR